MAYSDIERSALQAVCLYEELIKVGAERSEIKSAYAYAVDLVDEYGEDLDTLYNLDATTDYSLYYNMRSRLDLTYGEYIKIFA